MKKEREKKKREKSNAGKRQRIQGRRETSNACSVLRAAMNKRCAKTKQEGGREEREPERKDRRNKEVAAGGKAGVKAKAI